MLRPGLHNEIRDCLNRPPFFNSDDFDITIKRMSSKHVLINIIFAIGNGEFFKATIPHERDQNGYFQISTVFDPGEISTYEERDFGTFALLKDAIYDWAKRIAEDIRQQPVARLIAEQESRLKDLQKKLEEIPDEFATADQLDRVKDYLNQVEKELKVRIEKLEADVDARDKKLKQIHAEFELLRERAETTTIRKIVRAATTRFYSIASDPKLGTLIENGKKIIGLLPNISDKN